MTCDLSKYNLLIMLLELSPQVDPYFLKFVGSSSSLGIQTLHNSHPGCICLT